MSIQESSLRVAILLAVISLVIFASGCENPANSGSGSEDSETLVLPSGTIAGNWFPSYVSNQWHVDYRGNGADNDTTLSGFGKFALNSQTYPGQTITRDAIEGRLQISSFRGANNVSVFESSGDDANLVTPDVQMMRVKRLALPGVGGSIIRSDSADNPKQLISWWYASADAVLDGSFRIYGSTFAAANNVALSAGWNTMIFSRPDTGNWSVVTGNEPSGIQWHSE